MKQIFAFLLVLSLTSSLLSCDSVGDSPDAVDKAADTSVKTVSLSDVYSSQYFKVAASDEIDEYTIKDALYYYEGRIYLMYSTVNPDYDKSGGEEIGGITVYDADKAEYLYHTFSVNADGGDPKTEDKTVRDVLPDEYWVSYAPDKSVDSSAAASLLSYQTSTDSLYFGGGEYEYYLRNSMGVYGFNEGDIKATPLCDWANSDFSNGSILSFLPVSSVLFACSAIDDITGGLSLVLLTDAGEITVEKRIIELALLSKPNYMLTAAILKFNRENPDYRIVYRDYYSDAADKGVYTAYTESYQKYKLDLVSGNVPDICNMSVGSDIYQTLVRDKTLTDLYTLFDREGELSSGCLAGAYRSACETDGGLYILPVSSSAGMTCVKSKYVGGDYLTLDELYNASERAAKYGGSFWYGVSSLTVLNMTTRNTLSQFADFESGVCSFDSPEFIELLEYCNTYPSVSAAFPLMSYSSGDSYIYTLSDGTKGEFDCAGDIRNFYREGLILASQSNILSASSYLQNRFFTEEDCTFIGYPSYGGKGLYTGITGYAIFDGSAYKDAIWKFFSLLLSDDIQLLAVGKDNFTYPATVSALKKALYNNIGDTYAFRPDSGIFTTPEPLDELALKERDNRLVYLTYTQEDADFVLSALCEGKFASAPDETLLGIIAEDASAYFNGDKTAAETTAIIQSRAEIYISERYG